jgi:hypothetical protein
VYTGGRWTAGDIQACAPASTAEGVVKEQKIELKESERHPICPHCEQKLSEIHWHKVRGVAMTSIGYVAVYSCPSCRKVLAASASD